ncbi:MAG: hypothetical protein K2Z81_26090, partial [Cyanobacteria bacterium]|nr:hypothetical protein [Cyanobacteriota bacterium]
MQLASSQLVKRIEEQQIDLHWYESTVLIKVGDEIRVATLFHAKEVNEYSISAIDGSLIDSGRTESIDTALQRLSDCSFGGKILIDTLSVRIHSGETKELCLPTDHELFRATRACWLMLLPEEVAAQKLRGQWEEDCHLFTCELVKLNMFQASVWLRAADDVIQEATINSWLSPHLSNRFIYLSIRNSRHGREGIIYRSSSVAGALEVMSNLLVGRRLLIDTLVLKSNTPFEKSFADRIVPCDECLYELARRFFLHAASTDCSLPAEGLDPEYVRRCVMGDLLTSVLLSENVRAWNAHSDDDKSFACFDEKI